MRAPNDGGPAFPTSQNVFEDGKLTTGTTDGMSLRDYFAAAALQGLLANPTRGEEPYQIFASVSYRFADAMLAERAKRKEAQS